MTEKWKEVPNFEGRYEVSNRGRIRSVGRFAEHPTAKSGFRWWPGRIMKQTASKSADPDNPYLYVGLYDVYKRQHLLLVHTLVLSAFRGPRPSKKHVGMHLDDNPSNNRLRNLKWGTYKENVADMFEKGRNNRTTFAMGSEVGSAKLDETKVKKVVVCLQKGMLIKDIAAKFGVSSTAISHVKSGKYWSHVTGF